MQEASFNGFFKTLLGIVIFYYVFKFLARLFLPHLAKKVVEKAQEKFEQQQQQYQNQQHTTTRNDIPREKKKVGEYIDYEEVE